MNVFAKENHVFHLETFTDRYSTTLTS